MELQLNILTSILLSLIDSTLILQVRHQNLRQYPFSQARMLFDTISSSIQPINSAKWQNLHNFTTSKQTNVYRLLTGFSPTVPPFYPYQQSLSKHQLKKMYACRFIQKSFINRPSKHTKKHRKIYLAINILLPLKKIHFIYINTYIIPLYVI